VATNSQADGETCSKRRGSLEEIDESNAEDAEDSTIHQRTPDSNADFTMLSMEGIWLGGFSVWLRNEKVQAIKSMWMELNY